MDAVDKRSEIVDLSTESKIVQTDENAKDGQNKCPKCGSTDISQSKKTGKLRCNFCRHEFEPQKLEQSESPENLEGMVISSGAQNIAADSKDIMTLKCESCGAEVVIDTASASQARCHWCRNMLSINKQIPNGAIPDALLPFRVTKDEAQTEIEKFVRKRKFFAHPRFTREFTTENITGVYFPYMIVDVNAHMKLSGTGEILTRKYTRGSGNNKKTYYDADAYHVEREFDIAINDLTIESSADKLDLNAQNKTTNIINSIMPFDTDNCVSYNANYLRGYTSEKRDTNIEQLHSLAEAQASDVSRFAANDSLTQYDRGVAWGNEQFSVKGESWTAAYLPVWLYSYMQKKGDKTLLHYVAINARTKETMGSVPINMTRLWIVSALIEIFGVILALFFSRFDADTEGKQWLLLLPGIIFFGLMYMRYRNSDARHTYEHETERTVFNLVQDDRFLEHRKRLESSEISGVNNKALRGNLNNMSSDNILGKLVEKGVNLKDLKELKDITDLTDLKDPGDLDKWL